MKEVTDEELRDLLEIKRQFIHMRGCLGYILDVVNALAHKHVMDPHTSAENRGKIAEDLLQAKLKFMDVVFKKIGE